MDFGIAFIIVLLSFAWRGLIPIMAVCAGIGYILARKRNKRAKWVFGVSGALLPVILIALILDGSFLLAAFGDMTGSDIGFSDHFELPLQNHFLLEAEDGISTADISPEGEKGESLQNAYASVSGVQHLQENGDWLAGSYGYGSDLWFLINTRTLERISPHTEKELQDETIKHGFKLNLQDTSNFYVSHHFSWLSLAKILFLLAAPVTGLILFWKLVTRLLK